MKTADRKKTPAAMRVIGALLTAAALVLLLGNCLTTRYTAVVTELSSPDSSKILRRAGGPKTVYHADAVVRYTDESGERETAHVRFSRGASRELPKQWDTVEIAVGPLWAREVGDHAWIGYMITMLVVGVVFLV